MRTGPQQQQVDAEMFWEAGKPVGACKKCTWALGWSRKRQNARDSWSHYTGQSMSQQLHIDRPNVQISSRGTVLYPN